MDGNISPSLSISLYLYFITFILRQATHAVRFSMWVTADPKLQSIPRREQWRQDLPSADSCSYLTLEIWHVEHVICVFFGTVDIA